ncbi:cell shape-determining protein MreC [Clostridium polyendosporum]|uniref:Cell shape-determining protein MreC n=1 Tax=Clostridium polyendosporum TaxID=69208 RepID=A0A919RZ91_9CLOT|nr:rod shape-determining protein MreC [Clostridium polyendosporum]GIM29202.1 cell shape-determining protein MreC [Clostridium polyendosporum]
MNFLRNKLAVTVIVLSVSFLTIISYNVKRDNGSYIAGATGAVLNPVQEVTYTFGDKIKGSMSFIFNFSKVKTENKELKKKNIDLENKLIEYNNLKNENDRLRGMLDFKNQRAEYNYIGTHIIGKIGGSILDGYIIDRGTKDGLTKDMVVISPEGLVGQIIEVNINWSKVQSLVNENLAVSALVQSTGETTGIVKGYKDNNNLLAKIHFLPLDSEIKEGDIITTSGLGGLYPKDIRIGQVISIESDEIKVMKSAIIKPYVDFNKLEEIFVVVPKEIRGEVRY